MNKKIESGLLLDTHVWIWLMNGTSELNTKIIPVINQAAGKGKLFIPAISVWEVATLVEKKRITLQTSLREWVDKALSQPGVELVPLTPDISIESTQLPNGMPGDPADRMIVATARLKKLIILTRDTKILELANAGYVRAIEI